MEKKHKQGAETGLLHLTKMTVQSLAELLSFKSIEVSGIWRGVTLLRIALLWLGWTIHIEAICIFPAPNMNYGKYSDPIKCIQMWCGIGMVLECQSKAGDMYGIRPQNTVSPFVPPPTSPCGR